MSQPRYLSILTAAFCVALVISNVIANKIVSIFGLTLAGAVLLFPITYLFGDVLTEVYGYAQTRRIIWAGFALQIAAVGAILLTIHLPPAIPPQGATFDAALALSPWIVAGSLIAYWCGEFVNSYVLARLKLATGGRWLWTRTIGSTLAGQAVDTALFIAIAFWLGSRADGHALPNAIVWRLVWSNYIVKCGWEICATPITYAVITGLKRLENRDAFDDGTDFSPFSVADAAGSEA